MVISVVGTGYVGLVTGTTLAELGHTVTCVDIDSQKVEMMRQGKVPIYEPGLEEIFSRNVQAGRLRFTTSLQEAMLDSRVLFLALPTPPGGDGSADLSFVLKVAEDIAENLKEYTVVVNKSTVPVGTATRMKSLMETKTRVPFDVISNPEFLREGFAVEDAMNPARIIVGTVSEQAKEIIGEIYAPFTQRGIRIFYMDEKSSELTKYASNSFLAVKITFMNEVANYCSLVGADVEAVRRGMGSDDRIGSRFLYPGIGYGGSCFPKDVKALIHSGKEENFDFKILQATEEINQEQKVVLAHAIQDYFGDLKGKKIAVLGLAFKANTDDIREASSLDNIQLLLGRGATITACDPIAQDNVKKILGDRISFASNAYDAACDADCILIATEWAQFATLDLERLGRVMKNKVIFDGRNIFPLDKMEGKGFYYRSIGRRTILK